MLQQPTVEMVAVAAAGVEVANVAWSLRVVCQTQGPHIVVVVVARLYKQADWPRMAVVAVVEGLSNIIKSQYYLRPSP